MESKNLELVKKLIDRIADNYDFPTEEPTEQQIEEQTEEMRRLTGIDWDAEDLQMLCFEYWSHNSLDETAYLMFHESYPPVHNVELIFWKYKQGVVLDDQTVYEKYRFGKGDSKELEALPLEEMLKKIRKEFSGWQENTDAGRDGSSWRFDCLEQKEYWTDTHFWIFIYGRETEAQSESQILRFSCHNMNEEQINIILECMENFQCPLHIREENNHY